MFSPKKFSCCFVLALAACTTNSKSNNDQGGNGGDGGDSGGNGASSGEGGNSGASGQGGKGGTGQGGSSAAGSGGNAGGQGGSINQGGMPSTVRPNVVNKGACKPPGVKLTKVGTAAAPMMITQGKADDFMLVAERSGKIQRLKDGKLDGVFANYETSVTTVGDNQFSERGLLGFVLHPDYDTNGRFFLYYNRRERDPYSANVQDGRSSMVIAEGKRMAGDKTKAEATLKSLVVVPGDADHHIGGFLGMGRDGFLYAGFGDSGGEDNVRGARAKNFGDLRSKILRIDVDSPTRKVPGNLDKPGAAPQVWVYGVRNPFRGSFDSATGDLYLGDVGEFSFEEIDYVEFGKDPNRDFGWSLNTSDAFKKEGPSCGGGTRHNFQSGLEGFAAVPFYQSFEPTLYGHLPIKVIPHDGAGMLKMECSWMGMGFTCTTGNEGACSRAVIGGVVYRGKKMPDLDGRYIYGEHVHDTVDSFIVKDGAVTCEASLTADLKMTGTLQGITSFGTDKDGEVYITDLAGGNIYRIDPK